MDFNRLNESTLSISQLSILKVCISIYFHTGRKKCDSLPEYLKKCIFKAKFQKTKFDKYATSGV